ncbi:hypothetical protein RUND412_005181 [Rhizina undulata]
MESKETISSPPPIAPIPAPTTTAPHPRKRRAVNPTSAQAAALTSLFAKPNRNIPLPSGPKNRTLPPPPEIVANVQGSSAGAGSGEFHVYKASRRREYERLRLMDEEVRKEEEEREFVREREERRRRDEEKTERNRRRRLKKKGRKEEVGVVDGGKGVHMGGEGGEEVVERREVVEGRKEGEEGLVIHDDD